MRLLHGLAVAALLAGPALAAFPEDENPFTTPDATDPDRQAGMAAWEAQDWDGVVASFTAVAAAAPGDVEAWTRIGYGERKRGRFDAALAAYDRALTLDPDYVPALEYLGVAFLSMDRPGDAAALLARLDALCEAGEGCAERNELDAALTAYRLGEPWDDWSGEGGLD